MTEQELYQKMMEGNSASMNGSISEQEKWAGISSVMPALMRKVYLWMTLALAITGVTAFGVASSPSLMMSLYSSQAVMWVLIIATFVLVMALSAAINRMSLATATVMFIVYSVLMGVTMASIFVVYNPMVIAKVFFITAGTFGAMAFVGSTTKRDLSGLGGILMMGLIGLIIAMVVNIFLKSAMLDYVLSFIGVAIFTGLTAWDSQQIKKMLATQYDMSEGAQKMALMGALTLYLDFINLFLYLLRIFGRGND